MDTLSLIISSVLVSIPIFISVKEHLNLEKEIIVSIVRAVVQLVLVGYVLDVIFGLDNDFYTIILVLIMIINAAFNTKKRGGRIKKVVMSSFISIFIGTSVTISILVVSGAIKSSTNVIIPIAGMIVSNSMVAIGLSYSCLNNAFKNRSSEVEVKLSLGAGIKESAKEIIKESLKIAVTPTIDSAKTLGIVSLPGMMSGLILAGESPLMAIKFQIMVTFMLLSATSISSMIATFMGYRSFFNKRKQLLP